jgi:hypothetical protein
MAIFSNLLCSSARHSPLLVQRALHHTDARNVIQRLPAPILIPAFSLKNAVGIMGITVMICGSILVGRPLLRKNVELKKTAPRETSCIVGNDEICEDPALCCIICMENKIQVVAMPCFHATTCIRCANQLSQCSVCRQDAEFKRIYLS